jgi:hypothetical protein
VSLVTPISSASKETAEETYCWPNFSANCRELKVKGTRLEGKTFFLASGRAKIKKIIKNYF